MLARLACLGISTLLLGSCSMATHVRARFIRDRLVFVGVERPLGCISQLEIRDYAKNKVVWEVEDASFRTCAGDDPHVFGGQYKGLRTVESAQRLRPGAIYEVRGVATGSNYFSGAFRITRDGLYRIEDIDPDGLPMIETPRDDTPVEGPDEQTLIIPCANSPYCN